VLRGKGAKRHQSFEKEGLNIIIEEGVHFKAHNNNARKRKEMHTHQDPYNRNVEKKKRRMTPANERTKQTKKKKGVLCPICLCTKKRQSKGQSGDKGFHAVSKASCEMKGVKKKKVCGP